MIFQDRDGLPFVLDGFDTLARVSECHDAPLIAEAPLAGIWLEQARTVRPDGLLAVCSVCRCYVENADGACIPITDTTPNATLDDVREQLRYDEQESAR